MIDSESKQDRDAEDIYLDRRIRGSVYCSKCGYNLKTLPHVYACPECGNPYRARGMSRTGVFSRNPVYPPISSFVASAVFGLIGVVLLLRALRPFDEGRFAVGLVFVGITVWFVVKTSKGLHEFLQHRDVERQIAEEESE